MKTRLLLADDHPMFLAGLRGILEAQEDFQVVGEAAEGRQAVRLAVELGADVVIMDITLPGLNGLDATRRIREQAPGTRVIALSMHADRAFVIGMLRAGASGYLSKDSPSEELIAAIRAVRAGQTYLSPQVTGFVVEGCLSPRSSPGGDACPLLSNREREVLQLLAEGRTLREVAMLLQVGERSVETYRRRIMEKLKLRSVAQLVRYAIREGLTSPGL